METTAKELMDKWLKQAEDDGNIGLKKKLEAMKEPMSTSTTCTTTFSPEEKEALGISTKSPSGMRHFMRTKYLLFLTAVLQVTFVAMNTVFISKGYVLSMLATG